MAPVRRIAAATDFSHDAGCAVARAGLLAEELGADLSVLHVLDAATLNAVKSVFLDKPSIENDLLAASQAALTQLAAGLSERGVAVTTDVRIGIVLEEVLAEARGADLLVLGAHGMNRVKDRLLGTTAERILGRCPVPILVTRRPAVSRYARVAAAVDLSVYSVPVLQAALRVAPRGGIALLHAYDVPFEGKLWLAGVPKEQIAEHRGKVLAEATRQVETLIAAHLGNSRVVPIVERGSAAHTILRNVSRHDSDLLVVGKRGQSAVADFFLGSVTRHVTADAKCDVLVVPERANREGDRPPPPAS